MAGEERLPLLSPIDGNNAIQVRGLCHSFGSVKVMNDLSMTVQRGTLSLLRLAARTEYRHSNSHREHLRYVVPRCEFY